MTWRQFAAARLLLAEERVGSAVRSAQRAEDAAVTATKAALQQVQGNGTR